MERFKKGDVVWTRNGVHMLSYIRSRSSHCVLEDEMQGTVLGYSSTGKVAVEMVAKVWDYSDSTGRSAHDNGCHGKGRVGYCVYLPEEYLTSENPTKPANNIPLGMTKLTNYELSDFPDYTEEEIEHVISVSHFGSGILDEHRKDAIRRALVRKYGVRGFVNEVFPKKELEEQRQSLIDKYESTHPDVPSWAQGKVNDEAWDDLLVKVEAYMKDISGQPIGLYDTITIGHSHNKVSSRAVKPFGEPASTCFGVTPGIEPPFMGTYTRSVRLMGYADAIDWYMDYLSKAKHGVTYNELLMLL